VAREEPRRRRSLFSSPHRALRGFKEREPRDVVEEPFTTVEN
jgi:hypothetical protein